MCNVIKYIEEQELLCRRMCYAANADTPAAVEWGQLALNLKRWATDHGDRCEACQGTPKVAA